MVGARSPARRPAAPGPLDARFCLQRTRTAGDRAADRAAARIPGLRAARVYALAPLAADRAVPRLPADAGSVCARHADRGGGRRRPLGGADAAPARQRECVVVLE